MPHTPLLDTVKSPADVRDLSVAQLKQLADELRTETIDAVSTTGGHLGAGLGVVELTVALHHVLDTPDDIAALSFEQALAELERIVGQLESGQAPLEESIALYERGARLKAHCEEKLRAAQLRVEKIVVGPQGAERTEPADFS